MAESQIHTELVEQLRTFVVNKYLDGDDGSVLVDSAGVECNDRTSKVNGYFPDLIATPSNGEITKIIGEAKTINDIETKHSISQMEAFLRYCSQTKSGLLIIAVPWPYGRSVRNIMKRVANIANLEANKCLIPDMFQG